MENLFLVVYGFLGLVGVVAAVLIFRRLIVYIRDNPEIDYTDKTALLLWAAAVIVTGVAAVFLRKAWETF